MNSLKIVFSIALLLTTLTKSAYPGDWAGFISLEARHFFHDGLHPDQKNNNLSLTAQPEFYQEFKNNQSLLFIPFFRLDQNDPQRTHTDIRELYYLKVMGDWEVKIGLGKEYWGVIESLHLVDVINQTDLLENADGEDKLGQPMAKLLWVSPWGMLELFALPGFRERTFPGPKGRLRFTPHVDTKQAFYESSAEDKRFDVAARYSQTFGDWDIGLAHFSGTARDPRFSPGTDTAGNTVLVPYYDVIDQTSMDIQATKGGWLWKGELISRSGQGDRFTATALGTEYTFGNLWNTGADIGLLVEHLYDDRGDNGASPFEDDIFIGARIALNDAQSSSLLAGAISDRDTAAQLWTLEAERRLGNRYKLTIEWRAFSNIPDTDPFYTFRHEDHLHTELAFYF